jgi:hypothetical protein
MVEVEAGERLAASVEISLQLWETAKESAIEQKLPFIGRATIQQNAPHGCAYADCHTATLSNCIAAADAHHNVVTYSFSEPLRAPLLESSPFWHTSTT